MHLKYFFIAALALIFLSGEQAFAQCQEYLHTPEIVSLEEDADYLWLGTQRAGLHRYDKLTGLTQEFNTTNSAISGNRVRSMTQYNGQLLISTDSSLQYFDGTTFTAFSQLTGQLAVDLDGKLVVAGDTAVYYFEGSSITYQKSLLDLLPNEGWSNLTDLAIDASNGLWLSHFMFYEFQILHFDGLSWEVFDSDSDSIFPIESPSLNGIIALENTILATNWAGLYEHTGSWTAKHFWNDQPITDGSDTVLSALRAIEADQSNGYWVGSDYIWPANNPGKLAHSDNGDWTILPDATDSVLAFNVVHASRFDTKIIYGGTTKGLVTVDKACLNLPTGISQPGRSEQFDFYPNPTQGLLHFVGTKLPAELVVYDLSGREISRIWPETKLIDLTELSSGNYLLTWSANETQFYQRITVE